MSGQSKPLWASHLHPVGLHYYAGIVDSAEELIEKHKVATQSSFGTRSSTKKGSTQCSTSMKKENDDPKVTATAKVRFTDITQWQIHYNVVDIHLYTEHSYIILIYTDKSKSLLEPDNGRSCSGVQQHTIHCLCDQEAGLPIWQTLLQRASE